MHLSVRVDSCGSRQLCDSAKAPKHWGSERRGTAPGPWGDTGLAPCEPPSARCVSARGFLSARAPLTREPELTASTRPATPARAGASEGRGRGPGPGIWRWRARPLGPGLNSHVTTEEHKGKDASASGPWEGHLFTAQEGKPEGRALPRATSAGNLRAGDRCVTARSVL